MPSYAGSLQEHVYIPEHHERKLYVFGGKGYIPEALELCSCGVR